MIIRPIDLGLPPEELFRRVRDWPGSFFLDSAQAAAGLGAYSFIGFDPFLSLRGKDGTIVRSGPEGPETFRGDPVEELRRLLRLHQGPPSALLPFTGGAVGCLSFELYPFLTPARRSRPDDLGLPDLDFGFYDRVFAFEHATGRGFIAARARGAQSAEEGGEEFEAILRGGRRPPGDGERRHWPNFRRPEVDGHLRTVAEGVISNFTPQDYVHAISRIKDYLCSGDTYQVNLTQRFEAAHSGDPYALHERLRRLSPAPFSAFLDRGDFQIVSSSPERLLRVRDGRAETRPIKGTRPRGRTPEEDRRIGQELVASGKDRAELLMIVDLERNDLGRVCAPGSIRVDQLHHLESHPTVHHLVANVSGRLAAGRDAIDGLRAVFPGGSVTGAPKVRALQIIDELETCRRDLYTGALGYFGFDGDCDLNLAIRTITCRSGRAYYGVGGGIVADSEPEAEYEEALIKGRAMREAVMRS